MKPLIIMIMMMMMMISGMALACEKPFYTAENGGKDAEANISSGKLYLLRYGNPALKIDKETGLTIETLGCEPMPGMEDYIKSYNKTMHKHVLEKMKATPSTVNKDKK